MPNKDLPFFDQLIEFFVKIFVPAFVAISVKVATQIKHEKMNLTRILISFVSGVGCAYFVFPFVHGQWTPLIIGVVAMSGEKITEFIVYKWDVDSFLKSMISNIFTKK